MFRPQPPEPREATERMRIAAQADVQRTGHLVDAAVFLFALALPGTVVLVAGLWGREWWGRGGWLVVVRRALVDRGE